MECIPRARAAPRFPGVISLAWCPGVLRERELRTLLQTATDLIGSGSGQPAPTD
jgi:hypothetical protein